MLVLHIDTKATITTKTLTATYMSSVVFIVYTIHWYYTTYIVLNVQCTLCIVDLVVFVGVQCKQCSLYGTAFIAKNKAGFICTLA